MNYYPRHLGDYSKDAGYLSMLEHGAYTLALDWYYANERPIPRELAFSICKASSRAEKQAVHRVLQAFFKWDESSGWHHKRVEAELAKMREKRVKARHSATHRWGSERNANALLSNNQEPIAKSQSALAGYDEQPSTSGARPSTTRISSARLLSVIGGSDR
jgi:uncharacterized protein YdaU (DUF1376 family)